ncbi:hypothetical protein C8R43DRAFT_660140 [Mycena crocata]|nr:hypothetical protein C8R43DRAFT_660140 [Mycena crocata]
MTMKAAELDVTVDVGLGELEEDEDCGIAQEYVDPSTGEPLVVNVVGRISDVISLEHNLRALVLLPPLSSSIIHPDLYRRQHRVLEGISAILEIDERHVLGVEPWTHRMKPRVIVRFTDATTIGTNPVTTADILSFSSGFPIVPCSRPVLEREAIVLCRVKLHRKDTLASWAYTDSGKFVFNREFWMEATHIGRFKSAR